MEATFQSVCTGGTGVDEAATYVPTSGLHPAFFMYATHPSDDAPAYYTIQPYLNDKYWADSVGEIELIVCQIEIDSAVVELCRYTDGTGIARVRDRLQVTLVEAKTGEQVIDDVVLGRDPADCPSAKSGGSRAIHGTVRGGAVDDVVLPYIVVE